MSAITEVHYIPQGLNMAVMRLANNVIRNRRIWERSFRPEVRTNSRTPAGRWLSLSTPAQDRTGPKGVVIKIRGSVAFVTGANRGLGRCLTEQLVARGAEKVYAAARRPGSVTVDGVVPIPIDITDTASVITAADAARDVNLLINNAGTFVSNGFLDSTIEAIRAEMDSHYFGTLAVTRAFVPSLIANTPGAILNVASVLSWMHPGNVGPYSAAKAALWAQTNALREDLAAHHITVTALHVSYMDTDMVAHVDGRKTDPAAVAATALDGIEDGLIEVLADDVSRAAKVNLAIDRGAASTL
jgi:NAD(P)-dependent dehydrogenase (short-subunit alcohol dehydrogenase family)